MVLERLQRLVEAARTRQNSEHAGAALFAFIELLVAEAGSATTPRTAGPATSTEHVVGGAVEPLLTGPSEHYPEVHRQHA